MVTVYILILFTQPSPLWNDMGDAKVYYDYIHVYTTEDDCDKRGQAETLTGQAISYICSKQEKVS